MRILIVDDHAIVRKGLKHLLLEEYPSSTIEELGDGQSLITKVINEKWDIVICDLDMPGRGGLDALRQIKEISPQLPVLIVSIYPEDQYAVRVLKAGAAGYLNKEAATEELEKAVRQILQGRKYVSSSITAKITEELGRNSEDKAPHELLTDREFEVFKLIASGRSVSEIAEKMSLSSTTISTHRARLLAKMHIKTNAELTRYALDNRLI
jgi:two-component system invasion response regulator UvrY